MTAALFLILLVAVHRTIARLVRRDGSLAPAETWAATCAFHFAWWMGISFLLGFAGSFRLHNLLDVGLLFYLLMLFVAFLTARDETKPTPPRLRTWFSEIGILGKTSLLVGISGALAFLVLGIRMPPVSYDVLSYHLGLAVHLYQDGDFRNYVGESFMTNHFARGLHLLMAIGIMLSGGIQYVNVTQWLILPVLIPSVYTACRAFGVDRRLAVVGATLTLTIPVLLYQSSIAYADLFATGWFAIGCCAIAGALRFGRVGPVRIMWMFVCGGLALASKSNAIPHCLVLGLMAIVAWGWRPLFRPAPGALGVTLCGILIASCVGLPWPLRNWISYGSPVYPIMLQDSRDGLKSWEYPRSIAEPMSVGTELAARPAWQNAWQSWTTIDFASWRELGFLGWKKSRIDNDQLLAPAYEYSGYGMFGENGLLWLLFLLPSMIMAVAYGIHLLRNKESRSKGLHLTTLCVGAWLAYTLTVSAFWTRLSIFLPILGTIAFVVLIHAAIGRNRMIGNALLAMALIVALFDWSTAVFLNRQWERANRYFDSSENADYTPVHYAAWLSPNDPWIQAVRHVMDSAAPNSTVSYWTPIPEASQPAFTGYFTNENASVRQFLFPSIWPDPFAIPTEDEKLRLIRSENISTILLSSKVPPSFVERLRLIGGKPVFETEGFTVYKIGPPPAPQSSPHTPATTPTAARSTRPAPTTPATPRR